MMAFLRIVLGSILFGIWGGYALLVWVSVPNLFLRVLSMIPMVALFLALLGCLLVATALVLRPKVRPEVHGAV